MLIICQEKKYVQAMFLFCNIASVRATISRLSFKHNVLKIKFYVFLKIYSINLKIILVEDFRYYGRLLIAPTFSLLFIIFSYINKMLQNQKFMNLLCMFNFNFQLPLIALLAYLQTPHNLQADFEQVHVLQLLQIFHFE